MEITFKDARQGDAWSHQVDVEVAGGDIEAEVTDELKKLKREASLPGFRKGKVPMRELESRFGSNVRAEIIDRVVQDAVRRAITEKALELVAPPRVEGIDYESGGDLKFTAEFVVRPEIELPDYAGLRGEKIMRPIDDAAVAAVLDEIRASRAQIDEVDRPIQPGDVVTVDLTALGAGQVPIVGSKREGLRVLLASGNIPEAWIEGLAGRGQGESVVVPLPSPDKGEGQEGMIEEGGEERYHQIEVHKVESRTVPELDDAFAAEVAQVDTIDDLREQVRQNLVDEEERNARRGLERQLLDRLAESLSIDLPDRLVSKAADDLFEQAASRNPELDDAGRERLAVEAQAEAARRMKRELVVAEIRRREGFDVEDAEAEQALDQLVGAGLEPGRDQASRERMVDNLRESLIERKVLNFLVDKADVEVIEQSRQRRVVTPFDS